MPPFQVFSVVFIWIQLLMGTITNAFLVAVISIQWVGTGSKNLPPSNDLLLLGLGLANISVQMCTSGEYLLRFLWREVYNRDSVCKSFFVLCPFWFFSSFWINTWLCVFYCIKIVNFSHTFFTRLKMDISSMVPWLLLGSVVASLAINVSGIWQLGQKVIYNSTAANTTIQVTEYEFYLSHKLFLFVVCCFVPLVMIVTSAVLVLISLYRHTRQMQQNTTGLTVGPSMEAHIRAAKTILALLALYICFDLSSALGVMDDGSVSDSFLLYFYMYIGVSYPSLNSLILIFRNPKLKAAALRVIYRQQHEQI